MVPIRFTSLVLGLLLVLQALRVSLTQAHQARAMNGNKLAMKGENVMMVEKDLLDGESKAATRMIGLGGRKMVVDRVLSRKGIKEEQGLINQENSKISGKDSHGWKKFAGKSPNTLNDLQGDLINSLEPKKRKCSSLGCSSKSEVVPAVSQEHPPDSTADQREEAERLLKALNEIVNLIHKDYKGNEKPKRKPPINNHEPSD